MTRLFSKVVVICAVAGGLGLAVTSNLNAETTNLPELPAAVAQSTVLAQTPDDENLVVELKDWQETRITVKCSNVVPTKKVPPKKK